jgi:hypothetical protein
MPVRSFRKSSGLASLLENRPGFVVRSQCGGHSSPAAMRERNPSAGSRCTSSTLALRHEERVSQALREVGIALGTTFDLDDLLELILGKLTELVEADRATLYLLDESHDELVSRMVVGEQVRSIRMKVGHGIAGWWRRPGRACACATPTPIRASSATGTC